MNWPHADRPEQPGQRARLAAGRHQGNSGDTIVFASNLDGQTITLTKGELLISKNLTITGLGADKLTISSLLPVPVQGNMDMRVGARCPGDPWLSKGPYVRHAMKNVAKRMGRAVLVGGMLLLPAAAAQAQVNPLMQARMNNLMANAQMMQAAPLLGGGFNPAFSPAFAPGAGFVNPYTPALGGGFANPYTPGGFGGGVNPYLSSGGGYGGIGGYYTLIPPAGYFLQGTASIMKAYGTVVTADQQARIMSEQAEQLRIQNMKARFDFEMYRRANTIPYSEEQRRIAKNTLRRVQTGANPNEVISAKSPNILLHDLEGAQGKRLTSEPISLSEDILKHLNVTTKYGNLGLLRNDGRFTWPAALLELLPADKREEIEIQAQSLVAKATNGVVQANVLRDLQNTLDKVTDRLFKKVNDIPGDDYRAAKSFLADFDKALLALREPDNAVKYFDFQKWVTGGKKIEEIVDYMVRNGLRFAPAIPGDEHAYRALQAALAAYDLAYNNQQLAAAQPNGKE